MKNLLKNSFFSFFKNRVAIFLLVTIVFVTSSTYTMFQSASNSFDKSYKSLMENGQRHDYTIKELYNLEGNLDFKNPVKKDLVYGKTVISNDQKFVNEIDNKKSSALINEIDNHKYLAFPVQIKHEKAKDAIEVSLLIRIANLINFQDKNIDFLEGHIWIKEGVSALSVVKSFAKEYPNNRYQKSRVLISSLSSEKKPQSNLEIFVQKKEFGVFKENGIYKISNFANSDLLKTAILDSFRKKIKILEKEKFQKWALSLKSSSNLLFQEIVKEEPIEFSVPEKSANKFVEAPYFLSHWKDLEGVKNYREFKTKAKNQIFLKAKHKMHQNLLKKLDTYNLDKKNPKLFYKDVQSVKITTQKEAFKVVKETSSQVNKINIYSGGHLSKPKTSAQMLAGLKDKIPKSTDTNVLQLIKDDFSFTFVYPFGMKTTRYIDPSSYEVIVSPSYASKKGIKSIEKKTWLNLQQNEKLQALLQGKENFESSQDLEFTELKAQIKKFARDNQIEKALLFLGQTPFFVVGTGITPDFAFPIISHDLLIPNTNSQGIIYVNKAGYDRIYQANSSSPVENYIAFRFNSQVNKNEQEKIIKELNEYADRRMGWPHGISAIEKFDSTSENYLLTPQRIGFLDGLKKTILTVSWIITSSLIVFAAFIVLLVIKKQVDARRKQMGILMANGYSKIHVALSMSVISFVIIIIPSILGYLVGHFMQLTLTQIFHNYWTIPIWKEQFSWISLLLIVGVPFVFTSLFVFCITLFILRGSIAEIINENKGKRKLIFLQLISHFKLKAIKVKMVFAILVSNIMKMVVVALAFAASIIALSISISSINKFQIAAAKSAAATSYKYQVNLNTPTREAGLYNRIYLNNLFRDANSGEKLEYWEPDSVLKALDPMEKDHYDDWTSFHAPIPHDRDFSGSFPTSTKVYPYYMKNKIQMKSLLDVSIIGGINPWQIASNLMPINQKNQAELASKKFLEFTKKKIKEENKHEMLKNYESFFSANSSISKVKGFLDFKLKKTFKEIIAFGLSAMVKEYYKNNDSEINMPYFLIYNNILLDDTDETYSYLDSRVKMMNMNGEIKDTFLKVKGLNYDLLKENKSMINLSTSSLNALNNFNSQDRENVIPIVVNKYFQAYYKLEIGDQFNFELYNSVDRHLEKVKPQKKYLIVGAENTFDDNRIYTLQKYANKHLGFNSLESKTNNLKKQNKGFNGVMTQKSNPLYFRTAPMYSESGIYVGKNLIDINNPNTAEYKTVYGAFFKPDHKLSFPNPKVESMKQLVNEYGNGVVLKPLNTISQGVEMSNISDYKFNSINDLAGNIMNTVQIIIMFLTLSFVILIATMIIADNKKFISTLKVMGYRTGEIFKIFLGSFLPSLLLAIIISIPITFGIIEAIRIAIMNFGQVLIPFSLIGWEIAIATSLILAGFIIICFIANRNLKNTSLLQAFQQ